MPSQLPQYCMSQLYLTTAKGIRCARMNENVMTEKRYGRRQPHSFHRDYQDDTRSRLSIDAFRGTSRRSIITYATAIFLIFLIITYGSPFFSSSTQLRTTQQQLNPQIDPAVSNSTNRIPLEAHIMSKCPDAKDCLMDLVVPAMEKIVDKVDFKLSYIGTVDKDDNIHCKHGPTECLGNMMGLCANELFPNSTKISLGFATCLTMSYQRIPDRELVTQCSLEHGISFNDLNACISEEGNGLNLLEASVERSEKAGVKKSCTVRIGGEQWCVRDGGKWKDCGGGHEVKDLVKEVERRYNTTQPTLSI